MAFMIRFVSASALRYFNATGGPTRICTVGGFVTLRMFGSRAERGTPSPCPTPHGDDRRLGHRSQTGRFPTALQLGIEERHARGIVPSGMSATI